MGTSAPCIIARFERGMKLQFTTLAKRLVVLGTRPSRTLHTAGYVLQLAHVLHLYKAV